MKYYKKYLDVVVKAEGMCCLGGRLTCKVLWETLFDYQTQDYRMNKIVLKSSARL